MIEPTSQLSLQFAQQVREVYFGKNWTAVNLKDTCKDITWQQATQKIYDCNSIATLVFHMTYYVDGVLKFLRGGPLEIEDEYSFAHPKITNEKEWDNFLENTWSVVEEIAGTIEAVPEERYWKIFGEEKYGNYFRNFAGITEHMYYHIGQIVLLKKILKAKEIE